MVHLMGRVFSDMEAVRPNGSKWYQRPWQGYPGSVFFSKNLQGPICENPRIRPHGGLLAFHASVGYFVGAQAKMTLPMVH